MHYTTKNEHERIVTELESIGRMGEVMLEMYANRCDEHHDKYAKDPLHFFEWTAPTAWADAIILANLKYLKTAWDEYDAKKVDSMTDEKQRNHDHDKLRSVGKIILMFAIRRAERKIDTSTYAGRGMHSIAVEDAYAKLCSMFTDAHKYFRDKNL